MMIPSHGIHDIYTVQPVLSGQPREVAKVAAKARWLLKSGVDNANQVFIVMNIDCNTYITE